MGEKLKILFLSSEVAPFVKTGGLADVAGALPRALKRIGADVRLALPFYRKVREGNFETRPMINNLDVPLGKERLKARVLEARTGEGIPVYLIDRGEFYDRNGLYGNRAGDFPDNLERFTFFAHAAIRLADSIPFLPDLIHCHDWQTGLVPALIKGYYGNAFSVAGTPILFTIHNMGYQGLFPAERFSVTGLPRDAFLHPEGLEFWKKISFLKAGIVYSEAITTVSPAYAKEILTAEYGMGMEGILQKRQGSLHGILNGADYLQWEPAGDPFIPANFGPQNMEGKGHCKEQLIKEAGLDLSLRKRPLLGMISRLDSQKGLDLILKVLDDMMALETGFILLGSGDGKIEQAMRAAGERYPGRMRLITGFDEPLAHRIIAGVDMFLNPSRYEPCGLTQMHALKYGTVPVVRATGGLDNTIVQFNARTETGNGFKFGPYKPGAFLEAIRQAVDMFRDAGLWGKIMENGMKADFSWDRSARNYMDIYQSVVSSHP